MRETISTTNLGVGRRLYLLAGDVADDLLYLLTSIARDLAAIAVSPIRFVHNPKVLTTPSVYRTAAVGFVGLTAAFLADPIAHDLAMLLPEGAVAVLRVVANYALIGAMLAWYCQGLIARTQATRSSALTTAEAAGAATIGAELLKHYVGRLRPRQTVLHDVWLAGGFSFPSAEVTPAAAVAAGISTYYGNRWYVAIPAYAAVALVGVSRMRANAHWLSDVVGAIILGNVVARVLLWMHGLKGPDLQATPTPARLDER